MKPVLTIIFFILSISFSFGQVFFKQRVYGMEDRGPKEEVKITLRQNKSKATYNSTPNYSYTTTYSTYSVIYSKGKRYEYHRNPSPVLWEGKQLSAMTKKGLFIHQKGDNKVIHLSTASKMFREMGETNLANSLSGISNGYAVSTILQYTSVLSSFGFGMFVLAAKAQEGGLGDGDAARATAFRVSLGTFVSTTILNQIFKASLRSTLNNYNSKLSFNKKFAPNFAPSKITFKPAQISPFTPSLAPTLGFSWKL